MNATQQPQEPQESELQWWVPASSLGGARRAHLLTVTPTDRRRMVTAVCGERRRTWQPRTPGAATPLCPDCRERRRNHLIDKGASLGALVQHLQQPIAPITPQENHDTVWLTANYCARVGQSTRELAELLDILGLDAAAARHPKKKRAKRT